MIKAAITIICFVIGLLIYCWIGQLVHNEVSNPLFHFLLKKGEKNSNRMEIESVLFIYNGASALHHRKYTEYNCKGIGPKGKLVGSWCWNQKKTVLTIGADAVPEL